MEFLPRRALLISPLSSVVARIVRATEPPAKPAKPVGVVRKSLPSGLRLMVAERPESALVAIHLRVRAGSADAPEASRSVAHALEHLLFRGSKNRAPGEIDASIEALGGEISARTFRDSTEFSVTVPAANWRDTLALLSELVLSPTLSPDEWEREKPALRAELAQAKLDSLRTGIAQGAQGAYAANDPYFAAPIGNWAELSALSVDTLRTFHAASYRPERLSLALVGALSATEAADTSGAFFAPVDGKPARPFERPARRVQIPTTPVARVKPDPSFSTRPLVTGFFAWPTPPVSEADATAALCVLAQLLSDGGEGGYLGETLIGPKKPALAVGVEHLQQRAGGLFLIHTTARANDRVAQEDALIDTLAKAIENGFSSDEIDAARRGAIARLLGESVNVDSYARQMAFYDALEAPAFEDELRRRIALVPAGTVVQALKLFLAPARRTIATVGKGDGQSGEEETPNR